MANSSLTENDLRRELSEYRERFSSLGDDELFVLWFVRAFLTESEAEAAASECADEYGDKSVDAVLIDDSARIVFVIQGKYRKALGAKTEHRGDVLAFAQLASEIGGDNTTFDSLAKDMAPEVRHKLEEARKRILRHGYNLQLHYVTLGKCSASLQDEARRIVRRAKPEVAFSLFDGKAVLHLLADSSTALRSRSSLDLEIESGGGVRTSGTFSRQDGKTDIESWVFSMTDVAVAGLYERAGARLFARNVRGFLGSTEINRGMEETLAQ